jgi:hypothetical protein
MILRIEVTLRGTQINASLGRLFKSFNQGAFAVSSLFSLFGLSGLFFGIFKWK